VTGQQTTVPSGAKGTLRVPGESELQSALARSLKIVKLRPHSSDLPGNEFAMLQ
jgi:hypothetical protein